MSTLLIVLILLILLAVYWGGYGYRRYSYGPTVGWSPLVLILLIILLLALTGNL